MSAPRWLNEISLPNYRYPMRWEVVALPWGGAYELVMSGTVPDRNTGEPTRLKMSTAWSPADAVFRRTVHDVAFEQLMEFAKHEAEECFWVDGRRFACPHPEDPPHPMAGLPRQDLSGKCPPDLHPYPWSRHPDEELRGKVTAFLPRVEVRYMRYPVRWQVSAAGVAPVQLTLVAEVDGRDTGRYGEVVMPRLVPWNVSEAGLATLTLTLLVDFMRHEAAEAFRVDGVRMFDPHKEHARR